MVFRPYERQRAHEAVVSQIEDGISSGVLAVGDRLPSERELVDQFGVSRPTIREALRVAESLGLIKIRPGDPNGSIITARYPDGVARIVTALLRGNKGELGHLVEIRMLLEGSASYLAALQPDAQHEPLHEALRRMAEAADYDALQRADAAFHEAQGVASGNPFLTLIISAMEDPIRRTINVGLPSLGWPDARQIAVERHGKILEAIASGDAAEACQRARLNLFETYHKILPAEMTPRLRALVEMDSTDSQPF